MSSLEQSSGGTLRTARSHKTDLVKFLSTQPGKAIPRAAGVSPQATTEQAAREFLKGYGTLFGVHDEGKQLKLRREKPALAGRSFARFQQLEQGLRVFGGEVNVQLDAQKNVLSTNARLASLSKFDTSPTLSASQAQLSARQLVGGIYDTDPAGLTASQPELMVYCSDLLDVPERGATALVWSVEVSGSGGPSKVIRELVLIDARLGFVRLNFSQVADARSRKIYDAKSGSSLPGTLRRSEGQSPTGDPEIDNTYDYAGDFYDFFYSRFGRDGINNQGMDIVCTVHYGDGWQNAVWSKDSVCFGEGMASDDVLAHELTHGIGDYESNLFYYGQSGALEESLADVFGEFVDLTNAKGNDSPQVRWLIGEDSVIGAMRNMADPRLSNPPQPDCLTSRLYYCGAEDRGGVHDNSGVGNKCCYLMTDGGTFNGYTVSGLGIEKSAAIWNELQTNLLLSASDFGDVYELLPCAAQNLIASGVTTSQDVEQVRLAVEATQMNIEPPSCPGAKIPLTADTVLFHDDFEADPYPNWELGSFTAQNYWRNTFNMTTGWHYATSGRGNLCAWSNVVAADCYAAMTRDVALPTSGSIYLQYNQAWNFGFEGDSNVDGGVVEYSTDAGQSWSDAGEFFVENGYNGMLDTTTSNPLAGRKALVKNSNTYVTARADLSSLAGKSVRFRFRMGTENGWVASGWFIDDLSIFTCSSPLAPQIHVLGNRVEIAADDTTPNQGDATIFAQQCVGGKGPGHSFVIENRGTDTMKFTGTPRVSISGPDAADFVVSQMPGATVCAQSATVFTVRFAPTTTGVRNATVNIATNDPSTPVFRFAVHGTGSPRLNIDLVAERVVLLSNPADPNSVVPQPQPGQSVYPTIFWRADGSATVNVPISFRINQTDVPVAGLQGVTAPASGFQASIAAIQAGYGTFTLVGTLDPDKEVGETDETNSSATLSWSVGPDLSARWGSVDQRRQGKRYSLRSNVVVKNSGNMDCSKATLRVFACQKQEVNDKTDVLLKTSSLRKVRVGKEQTVRLNISVGSAPLPSGSYLRAEVYPAFPVDDANRKDNTVWITVP